MTIFGDTIMRGRRILPEVRFDADNEAPPTPPEHYSTLVAAYDARDAGDIPANSVVTVEWSGVDGFADGSIEFTYDGSDFSPHPLTIKKLPAAAIGQSAWVVVHGATLDFPQGSPRISTTQNTANSGDHAEYAGVYLDTRMSLPMHLDEIHLQAHVTWNMRSIGQDDRTFVALRDPTRANDFAYALCKWYDYFLSIAAVSTNGTYIETWAIANGLASLWAGTVKLSVTGDYGSASQRSVRADWLPDAGGSVQGRTRTWNSRYHEYQLGFLINAGGGDTTEMTVKSIEVSVVEG